MSLMNGRQLTVRRLNAPLIRCSRFAKVAAEARAIMEQAIASGAAKMPNKTCKHHTCNFVASYGEDYCSKHINGPQTTLSKKLASVCAHCASTFQAGNTRERFCSKECFVSYSPKASKPSRRAPCEYCGKMYSSTNYSRRLCYTCSPKS